MRKQPDADPDPATQTALRLLKARSRSRHELSQALAQRGHPPEVLAAVLEKLAGWGYLDDRRFAVERAAALLRAGKGPAAVLQKLEAHGIPEGMAREALAEQGFDELAAGRALLAKRPLPPARAARLLLSRGFSEGTVESLLGGSSLDRPSEDE